MHKPLPVPLRGAIEELGVNLIVLAEPPENMHALTTDIGNGFSTRGDFPSALQVLSNLPEGAVRNLDDDPFQRTTTRELRFSRPTTITLVAVHLPSKLFRTGSGQALAATAFAQRIVQKEAELGHQRTIVIGDFNMHPFEEGMVGAQAMHATFCRAVAERERREVDGRPYSFFYSPMWQLMGDESGGVPGTYFRRAASPVEYFWSTFDQVLIRPALLPCFAGASIIRRLAGQDLLTAHGLPDKRRFSDHLPIVCRFNTEA